MSAVSHTPRPPYVPQSVGHAWQRRFGASDTQLGMPVRHDCNQPFVCSIEVFRDAEEDAAELNVEMGLHTRARIGVRLNAGELRDLAARLLDAAHDIETLPAATLARAARGGEA